MKLHTMAMEITEKTWPIAVAVLGAPFASIPFPEVAGNFVIINTFNRARRPVRHEQYLTYGRARRGDDLELRNIFLTAEEFHYEFDWDKRKKNTEVFFDVTCINSPKPYEPVESRMDKHIRGVVAAYMGEDEPSDQED